MILHCTLHIAVFTVRAVEFHWMDHNGKLLMKIQNHFAKFPSFVPISIRLHRDKWMDANQHWNTYQILIAYLVDIFHWTLPKHLVASNVHSSCIFRHFSRRQFWICSDDLSFFTFVLATFCYHLFWYCQKSMANYVCRVSCTVYIPFYHVHSLRRYVQRKLHYFVYNFFDEFKVMKCLAWSSLKAMNKSFWFHSVRFPCEHFLNRWHKQWKQIENHKSTCQHELQKRNSIKKKQNNS